MGRRYGGTEGRASPLCCYLTLGLWRQRLWVERPLAAALALPASHASYITETRRSSRLGQHIIFFRLLSLFYRSIPLPFRSTKQHTARRRGVFLSRFIRWFLVPPFFCSDLSMFVFERSGFRKGGQYNIRLLVHCWTKGVLYSYSLLFGNAARSDAGL